MPQFPKENQPPPHTKGETPGEPGGSQKKPHTAKEIQTWLISQISRRLQIEPEEIDVREPFTSYGLPSRETVNLSGELEEWLGCRLSPTLLYEYPCIETLSQYLASDTDSSPGENSIIDETRNSEVEAIAIIGIGCRFPGASGPESFWRLLRDGVDAITEVPVDRWDPDFFYNPNPDIPGKMNTRWGGFLEQIDQFDPNFFGISPREAARMDPQQRLLLEVTWEALEDAGQVAARLAGTNTGVFVGISNNDYSRIQSRDLRHIDAYAGTGNALSIAANRLSYFFNLRGPSIAVDTACSSSLAAVHLACRSISAKESTLALAGGVNLIISPEVSINFSKAGVSAPDGRCKTFDARANGYVRSEGAGIVVLKSLSTALADGDPIYAVILGSAVNQDGRTNGLMAPSPQSQEEVLGKAYKSAGVPPGEVQYVETHGTGTLLGDPIEVKALGKVLTIDRASGRHCSIGSVKTNIGHLEAAAGIASLIKVALSLQHQMIPASLHFQKPNPHIPFDHLPLRVQKTLSPWPEKSGVSRAGVSSFGFGGTNVHLVLREAPEIPGLGESEEEPGYKWAQLLPLSAHSAESLQSLVRLYQDFFEAKPSPGDDVSLKDVCYTASMRRSHHDHRLALVGRSREEWVEQLGAFIQEEVRPNMSRGRKIPGLRRKLVFVFSGQGSQWFGMGRQLLQQEPVFREALEQCHQALQQHVDWSLFEELTLEEERSRLKDIDVIQPTLFAFQVALTALWRSWGIEPDAVVGHSMGEVAAAHAAGVLTLEDAVRIITRRSQLMKRASGKGSMAVVELTREEAQHTIACYKDRVSIAVSNSPTSTVLSGDPAALKEILDILEPQEIFCKPVKVDVASHSPQMDPLRNDLLQELAGIQPRPASFPIYSTMTGMASEGLRFDADYWVRNLREPVLFSKAVQQLLESGHDIFIEISPHPILLSAISQILHHCRQEGTVLPSLRREEDERSVMLGSLGALYTTGIPLDWKKFYPTGGGCIRLPSYPWQRERCWLELKRTPNAPFPGRSYVRGGGNIHPLLGHYLYSAVNRGMYFWEMDLGTELFPYLEDHRVQGVIVLPGAVYVEMALAASEQAFGSGHHVLENLVFKKALFLPEVGTQTVQLVISAKMPGTASFQLFGLQAGDTEQQPSWTLHAEGTIHHGQADTGASPDERSLPEKIQSRCSEIIPGVEHYQAMQERGIQYGPSFRGVEQIWRCDGEAIGRLGFSKTTALEPDNYKVHPALLDACFQVLAAAPSTKDSSSIKGDLFLPVGLDSFQVYNRVPSDIPLWSHALLRPGAEANADSIEGDVFLVNKKGQVIFEAPGLKLRRQAHDTLRTWQEDVKNWFYEIHWESKPRVQQDRGPGSLPSHQPGSWLIFTDGNGVGEKLKSLLEGCGHTCVMVSPGETAKITKTGYHYLNPVHPGEFHQLIDEAFGSDQPPCRGVVHLWGLDTAHPGKITLSSIETAQEPGTFCVLHLVQALALVGWKDTPRLWLVTRGTRAVGKEPGEVSITQSPLWGLRNTLFHEHPELRSTIVDLDPAGGPGEVQMLFRELWPDNNGLTEDRIVLRGDVRYVPRLVRYPSGAAHPTQPGFSPAGKKAVSFGDRPFRLEIATPGVLDNLTLREATRRQPGPGEVEVQVYAAGLNFLDVLSALGMRPDLPDGPVQLGIECAGRIKTLGEGVEDLCPGDEVIAIAPASFSAFTTTSAAFVVPRPGHLSTTEAAAVPIAFVTAYYALYYPGRLRKGERILIHSAAGGVGLAAVQLAQLVGAEVFATAGSPEKREFLRSMGIKHVMDSRSLAFADEVMEHTGGKGIDVILNSLTGDAIPKGLSILSSYGRFLEIGKSDIYKNSQLGLWPFQKNLSYSAIDLALMIQERPALVGSLLREVMQLFTDRALTPLPLREFSISEIADAFRHMAQARHIGKIVVSLQDQEVLVAPKSGAPVSLHREGTYIITGGLGGLGITVARWTVEQGAKNLVLIERNKPSAAAREALETMREAGARVVVANADVTGEQEVADVLAEIDRSMPPLRGIIHAAGVLDDAILLQSDQERFKKVMAPKIKGAWHLHTLTRDKILDFFVLFSSAASLLGSPGQGNYSAANAFLDGLAYHRQAQGLPALSINWGPWAEVGLAAQPDRASQLAARGIMSIAPEQGVEALSRLLGQGPVQVLVMPINWIQYRQLYPPGRELPLLTHLIRKEADVLRKTSASVGKDNLFTRDVLLATEPGERRQLLESYLREQVAKVLGLSPSRLDVRESLNSLGIDSLMAVELKNRIERSLEVAVSMVQFLRGPSVQQLTALLLDQLTTTTPPSFPPDRAVIKDQIRQKEDSSTDARHLLAKIDQLSDEEVNTLLDDMLAPGDDK